ncbi:MAG: hypothetical protein HOC71_15530, partial [Candidatus Latescibacteria bacterium]|nr:hypothetical protein [Candidatus Latescibacterota bacterium]
MATNRRKMIINIIVIISVVWSGYIFAAEEFTFVNFSDVHVPGYGSAIGMSLDENTLMPMHNPQRIKQFVNECIRINPKPDFAMNSGDTGDAGWMPLLRLYQKLMRPLVDAGIPVYTVVGNHDLDYAGIGRQELAEMYDPLGPAMIGKSGTRYSFEHKGCHFIVMNNRPISGLIRFNPMDIEWLRKDLEKVDVDTRILLFMHANLPVEDTHHIVELLQHYSKPVIFMGHNHRDTIDSWGGIPVIKTNCLY